MSKKYFLLNFLFIYINCAQIINNPIPLNDRQYPFVLSNSDNVYYYVITSEESLKINKESGNIEKEGMIFFSNEALYCSDISKNNYIFESNNFYHITYNPFINISKIPQTKNADSFKDKYTGCIPQYDEFIIYGYDHDSKNLIFLSLSQDNNYKFSNYDKLSEKISCKFIENNEFICATLFEKKINLIFFCYNINNSNDDKFFLTGEILDNDDFNDYINIALYDTIISKSIKILCKQNEMNWHIYCNIFEIKNHNEIPLFKYIENISDYFIFESTDNYFSEKDCSFSEFNKEYIFCCGLINKIKCTRLDFNGYRRSISIIRQFDIIIDGKNTYLTIRDYNLSLSIFFMNTNKVYEYKIYKPVCYDKEYTIINKLNESFKERLSNLFTVRTNNFYLQFKNLINKDYILIEFMLNNVTSNFDNIIKINNNDYIIDFIIRKNERNIKNLELDYNVYIGIDNNFFYSEKCKIKFNIKEEGKNYTNMNCETLKENYIKYENNCYIIINSTIKSFYDPEYNNESSCYQKFNLYIKENSNECIEFPGKGYYISNNITGLLLKCHENCLSCSNGIIKDNSGNLISMECLYCKDLNDINKTMIQFEKNCFNIIQYDENKVTFNITEMNSKEIGSCLYFNKSIYYGQHTCKDKPDNTYYVLNGSDNTGVIKDCNISCKSCHGESNDETTNCIECAQNYSKTEYANTDFIKEEIITSNYLNNESLTKINETNVIISDIKNKIK